MRFPGAGFPCIKKKETEIAVFKPQEYWLITEWFGLKYLPLRLVCHYIGKKSVLYLVITKNNSRKLNQFSISSNTEAKDMEQKINSVNI